MAKNSLVTVNDLSALEYYTEQQRAQVLACYLLNPHRYSMQEVAQLVLHDQNPQAGQRVSLITRSYGFSARNAGRYAQQATEQDVWDFVRLNHPERCGGLPEGTFDAFIRSRQEQRRAEQQREQARRQAQRQEEARRQAELARLRQEEQRRLEAERLRQQERVRQELSKRQRAEALCQQAAQHWHSGPGPDMAEGIRLYREGRAITWQEEGRTCAIKASSQYYTACADMAEQFFAAGDLTQALIYCVYLCDEHPKLDTSRDANGIAYRGFLLNSEEGRIIGRGYAIRAKIFLDHDSGYFNAREGLEAAEMGSLLCRNVPCLLYRAQCLETGTGTERNLRKAISLYQELAQHTSFKAQAEERIQALKIQFTKEITAEVAATLNRAAPDAFPMAGYEALSWEAYRDTVLDIPALWELYRQAHSTVQTKGLLFKRNEYHYHGQLTESQFSQFCRLIWEDRWQQYDALSSDYVPCPQERLRLDEFLRQGLELAAQDALEAVSLLRLPALCGSKRAQQALAELCIAHPQESLLRSTLSLLERDADEEAVPLLAKGYAQLNDWTAALSWAARGGEPLLADIHARLEQAPPSTRERLAEQYVSGPKESRDYVRAAQLYLGLPELEHAELCAAVCARAHNLLHARPKEERPWPFLVKLVQKILDTDHTGKYQLPAQYAMGMYYLCGLGVEQDKRAGLELMKKCMVQKYPPAVCYIAGLHLKNGRFDAAIHCLEQFGEGDEECAALLEEARQAQERARQEALTAQEYPLLFGEGAPGSEEDGPGSEEPVTEITEPAARKAAQNVSRILIAGETQTVKNATQAVTISFQTLLQAHGDRLEDCLREISQLTADETRSNSVFRKKAAVEAAGRTVWLGLSTGFPVKCAMTSRLCEVLGLPAGTVSWFSTEGLVYENP